jgi:hypothetical protein
MKLAIVQPCYLPWKGYFHLIRSVDHFVFLDDVQYPRARTWRNRNQIIINGAPKWINVPIEPAPWRLKINEVAIRGAYAEEHWRLMFDGYRRAPHFHEFADAVRAIVVHRENLLARLTIQQTHAFCQLLGISTATSLSSELRVSGLHKTELLVEICRRLGATEYISGPSARNYIEPQKFAEAGIALSYFDYQYPEYPQLSTTFTHQVSIVDMTFNVGSRAPEYIWAARA